MILFDERLQRRADSLLVHSVLHVEIETALVAEMLPPVTPYLSTAPSRCIAVCMRMWR